MVSSEFDGWFMKERKKMVFSMGKFSLLGDNLALAFTEPPVSAQGKSIDHRTCTNRPRSLGERLHDIILLVPKEPLLPGNESLDGSPELLVAHRIFWEWTFD